MRWWKFVVASEIRKILAFRADFWVVFLGQTFVQLFVARALWENIFSSSGKEAMEGFTLSMVTLYYVILPIGNRMLTGENIGFLSREIYDGSFSKYLLYPISFFHYKTLTYMTYSLFYSVQLILIFIIYQIFFSDGLTILDLQNLGIGCLLFLIASFAYCRLAIFIELISLWADNVWTLMVMCRFFVYFFGGGFVPIVFFPSWFQSFLSFTPFPYLITLPIRTIMGISTPQEMGQGLILLCFWSFFFYMASTLLWNKGQYKYTGVGI